MIFSPFRAERIRLLRRLGCAVLAVTAVSPMALGQGYGAIQAVRQRVSGLQGGPGAPPVGSPPGEQPLGSPVAPPAKLDTTYVSPTASALAVIRPAQIVTSPAAQMLPVEVVTAAGRAFLGMDPADVDEVILFVDPSGPTGMEHGVVFKFNKPFRAVNIPPSFRGAATLSEFNGKKYLKAASPTQMSFYGPNNTTMIVANDDLLRKVVSAAGQPKSGGIIDLLQDVPGGNDCFAFVDFSSLNKLPMVQAMFPMVLAQAKAPPEAKQIIDSISAIELRLNLLTRGPVSLVAHFNDEAGAQQVEALLEAKKPALAEKLSGESPPGGNPIMQAQTQWRDRMIQKYWPQRSGADISFHIDADDPLQPQLLGIAIGAGLSSKSATGTKPGSQLTPPEGATPSATPAPQ